MPYKKPDEANKQPGPGPHAVPNQLEPVTIPPAPALQATKVGDPTKPQFCGIESDTPSASRVMPPELDDSKPELHKKTSDKVAIVGFTETKNYAPFQDPTWELWGENELYNYVPRLDVLFEIHNRDEYGENFGSNHGKSHLEWLRTSPIPVYMARDYKKEFPKCVVYPWREVIHMTPHSNYLNNQISVMVALAVYMEYKEIALYGCEMAHHSEYGTQRPSVEFYLGIAEGRGTKVTLPPGCTVLHTPFVYGLERGSKWTKMLLEYSNLYQARVNQFTQQQQMAFSNQQQYIGAKNAIDEVIRHKLGAEEPLGQ